MVLAPVAEREMRVLARRRGTYRLRVLAAASVIGLAAWNIWDASTYRTVTSQGHELFIILSVLAFGMALLTGAVTTSDCLSKEKRDGTLGLLFLTPLKSWDVIFGKLTANSWNAFYLLLGTLPTLAIPALMGGVSPEQLLKTVLSLFSSMVFSVSAGIFISAYSRNERKALVLTIFLVAGILALPFLLTMLWFVHHSGRNREAWIGLMFSPGFSLGTALDGSNFWWKDSYWFSIFWIWFYSAIFLRAAVKKIPHSWSEGTITRAKMNIECVLERKISRRTMTRNPFTWLALRGETGTSKVWFFVGFIFLMWLGSWMKWGQVVFDRGVVWPMILCMHGFLKFWFVAEASRRMNEDRKSNAFELLLSTPLKESEIIRGQWRALLTQFGLPILFLVGWESFIFCMTRDDRWNQHAYSMRQILTTVFLVTDFIALAWAGMWCGLKFKSRAMAIGVSLALVLFVPYLLSSLTENAFIAFRLARLGYGLQENYLFLGLLTFFSLATDYAVAAGAWRKMRRNFRRIVTEEHFDSSD